MAKYAHPTPRQQEIYEFLKDKILNRGYGPTVREIGANFGIASPNGVVCHLKALERKGLITREPNMSRAIQLCQVHPRMSLPLAGRIAAGLPLLAVPQVDQIDFTSLLDQENHSLLKVSGDSLNNELLADGDYLVIRMQETCRDGEIVIAVVEGGDVSLKRYFKEPKQIRLEPVNAQMKPIYTKKITVLGVVVAVIRTFDK